MSTQSILLTGGTGFVGSHAAERLLADGHVVRCLVRPGRPSLSWLDGLRVDVVDEDPFSPRASSTLMRGIDTVVHVAGVTKARRPEDYVRGNVDLTRALIDGAIGEGVRRFILLSSLTAVGPSTDGSLPDESAPCVPITDYGQSKLEAERVCRDRLGRIEVTILRPPAVYGPRDRDILEMFRWVSYGLRPIIGSREKTISLIHARDLAAAISRAAAVPRAAGRTYFVSDPAPYRFSDLISRVAATALKRTFPLFIPGPVLYAVAGIAQTVSPLVGRTAVLTVEKARDLLQRHWVCSARAAQEDLGYESSVPLDEGIRETHEWYTRNGWL